MRYANAIADFILPIARASSHTIDLRIFTIIALLWLLRSFYTSESYRMEANSKTSENAHSQGSGIFSPPLFMKRGCASCKIPYFIRNNLLPQLEF
jgi:hypothetical protein